MTMTGRMEVDKYASHTEFWAAVARGGSRMMDFAPTSWRGSDAYLCKPERRIVTKHLQPLYTGAFVAAFLFGTFRVSGSRWFARFRDAYGMNNHRRTPISSKTITDTSKWQSYLDRKGSENKDLESDFIQLSIDLLLSIVCGCSSVIWFSKPTEILEDFEKLPLIHGKSLVHMHFCPELESAHDRFSRDLFENCKDDKILHTFHYFVQNCRTRSEFIASRKLQGFDTPDIIPYPGLKPI